MNNQLISSNTVNPVLSVNQILLLIAFVLGIVILTGLIGQWLWNNILVKYVTFVKPIEKWYEFVGLTILSSILFKTN